MPDGDCLVLELLQAAGQRVVILLELIADVEEAQRKPLDDIRCQLVDVLHREVVKNHLEKRPYFRLILLGFKDFLSGRNKPDWHRFVVEDLDCLLNIVDTLALHARLRIQTLQDVELRLMEVQDTAEQNACAHFLHDVAGR